MTANTSTGFYVQDISSGTATIIGPALNAFGANAQLINFSTPTTQGFLGAFKAGYNAAVSIQEFDAQRGPVGAPIATLTGSVFDIAANTTRLAVVHDRTLDLFSLPGSGQTFRATIELEGLAARDAYIRDLSLTTLSSGDFALTYLVGTPDGYADQFQFRFAIIAPDGSYRAPPKVLAYAGSYGHSVAVQALADGTWQISYSSKSVYFEEEFYSTRLSNTGTILSSGSLGTVGNTQTNSGGEIVGLALPASGTNADNFQSIVLYSVLNGGTAPLSNVNDVRAKILAADGTVLNDVGIATSAGIERAASITGNGLGQYYITYTNQSTNAGVTDGSGTTAVGGLWQAVKTATGDDANDALMAGIYQARLFGGGGQDILSGGIYADELFGGAGNDTLNGGAGSDSLDGGDGDDLVFYDAVDASARVFGGSGYDTLNVVGGFAPTGFNLTAQGFERAFHHISDTASQPWSSIRDIYASNWARIQSTIILDIGTKQERNFDFNGNQAYSEFINYYYDIAFQNAVTRQVLFEDSGVKQERFYDYASDKAYTSYNNFYADVTMPNTVTRQVIFEDPGTKQERFFDYRGNQAYSEYINFYTDLALPNTVTRQVIFEDPGTKQERFFDHNNTQAAYREYINYYTDLARPNFVTRQVGFNDAGAVAWEYFF